MSIDIDTIRHVARLARIKIADHEIDKMKSEFSAIIDFVDKLNEVDITDVSPSASVVDHRMPMRQDRVDDGNYPDDIVANAPASEDHFFVVPKVIE